MCIRDRDWATRNGVRLAKKNFKKGRTVKELQFYIVNNKNISIRKQCELLDVSRSNFYYEPIGESELNLKTMRLMDEEFLDCLLYTSDAADDLTRVDLGGRRIIKKKNK